MFIIMGPGLRKDAYLSKNGRSSAAPGVFLQSLMSSAAIANIPMTLTPAALIRSLASVATRWSKVPLASELAKTSYPSALRERERKAVHTYFERYRKQKS